MILVLSCEIRRYVYCGFMIDASGRQGRPFQTANMPPRLKRRQAGPHFQRASPKGTGPLDRFPSCLSRGYWQKEGGVIRGTAKVEICG